MSDLPKILVIDDDLATRTLILKALSGPYELIAKASGEEALAWLEHQRPEILLVDVFMPGINGLEICRHFKTLDDSADVPVMFISGQENIDDRLQCYEAGGADFVAKPFHVRELKAKVDTLLAISSQTRQVREMASFASNTAMTAMTSMSEMGALLDFLKQFNACTSYLEVIETTLKGIGVFELHGAVQILTPKESLLRSDKGPATPLEASVIEHMRSMERIAGFKTRLSIRYDHVALLINNMPVADEALCGRIRDHLAILIEAADVRVKSIIAMQLAMDRGRAIENAVTQISETLHAIDENQRQTRTQVRTTIEEMTSRIEKVLLEVALTNTEESYLMRVVRDSAEQVINAHGEEASVQNQLSTIVKELQNLMSEN